jgi:leucyl aminopeptidase
MFSGKQGEILTDIQEEETFIHAGLGKKEKADPFSFLKTGISLMRSQLKKIASDSVFLEMEELEERAIFFIMEGIFLEGLYDFSYKKKEEDQQKMETLIVSCNEKYQKSVDKAKIIAQSRNLVRELVDTPANILTTTEMAGRLEKMFKSKSLKVEVWDKKRLEKENLQGLLNVGKGSDFPPYLVKVHYKPENPKKQYTLIGKGIIFDTGGYSLKPSEGMLDMKGDMAGAATVAGILNGAAQMKLPVEIIGLFPLAENAISGSAYKVSDVIRYRNGKSVEVVNTDAEGRLVLADALIVSGELEPEKVIDFATLTGACMVALGPDIYGVFSPDEAKSRDFTDFVNKNTSEKGWPLPVYDKYRDDQMKSKIADLKNTCKRWGGAITATLFLKEFVPEGKEWMHMDIAGPFFDEGLGLFDGQATGIPVESMLLWLESQLG